ncbi:MAG: M20/M25/M40 family metallo-hydrolase [Thermoanaerobaculia bacterium]
MEVKNRHVARISTLVVILAASAHLGTAMASLAGGLDALEQRLVARVDAQREHAVELLRRAVDVPSATENLAGVRQVGAIFAAELAELGFATRWVDLPPAVGRAGHLVAEHRGAAAGTAGPRLLLLGHLDTVLEGEPFRREAGRAYGSGVSDMKGGDVVIVEALRALAAEGMLADRQVTVVMTGDEEDSGEPQAVSRAALVEAAEKSDLVLAFEGSVPGVAVVGRRGFAPWRLETTGSTGHSSRIFGPDRGDGAIFAMARILAAFRAELPEPYLTFNASLVVGGTQAELESATASGRATGKLNVVPAKTIVEGDLRFLTAEQLARAEERMRAIVARPAPQTSAAITFVHGMPSMAPTAGNRSVLAVLDRASRDLGTGAIVAQDPSERGAGDISFVADLLPGLDGLGALGEREHAPGEYVDLDELPRLVQRAALLIHRLRTIPAP